MAAESIDHRVNKRLDWRAEFCDPALEAFFRRSMQAHDACQMRHALWVIACLFLTFSLADYTLVEADEAFTALMAMRLTVALACALLAMAVWQRPSLAQRTLPINVVCLLTITGLLMTFRLNPEGALLHLASVVSVSMVLYLFVPNRLPWRLAGNAYLVSGCIVAMLLWSILPSSLLATSLLLMAFVNLLGWMTVNRLGRLQREQFALLLEERNTNRRLEVEIAERNLLEERLRHMARIDPLTGVANRRRFFELAEQERRRANRDGTPLSLCMVDIDHFKAINDRHGHAIGDLALTMVAARCQSVLRESDIIGRYGGEEFIIALPLANLITARNIAERLRHAICRQPLDVDGLCLPLTITIGISRVDDSETGLEESLQRADRALYAGKASGRNRVVVMSPEAPGVPFTGTPPRLIPVATAANVATAAPAEARAGEPPPGPA
ncbi:GGDEF domain-containing protein [Halomonas cerina]|uniref:diguanylate cyclase n=1 Tax=Halomonas cerina TaxID=447424 RepID=A0A839VEX6_9GAMM|nr:GGDEF domain-containing protein [Halomonas cerina]MBB3191026.1 diguanylate cyclase (GGDEF)-like protein [Halomonas cerina]